MEHLVIIGNGVAGITTARNVRKLSDMQITVISNETDYFYSRTALMYIFMGHMRLEDTQPYENWFWEKNRIGLLRAHVEQVDHENKKVVLDKGTEIPYTKLLIATGSSSNKFGWPGQDLPGVQGLYHYQDLTLLEENIAGVERAVIVGGGLIGIELAEMLVSRNIPVTFVVREKEYWDNILPIDEAAIISNHVREHGIDLRLETNLVEILAGPNGRVRAITTDKGEEISCQLVGLTPGVHPNIDLAKNSGIPTQRGILVNDFLETEIPDIFAAGDCTEIKVTDGGRNRIEQLWYTGRQHGQAVARTICGYPTEYERGIWFNSAKFIDIEYHTYGFVSNVPRDGESSFYWEDEGRQHCVRLVYDNASKAVTGMNFFGIRMKHPVCESWIRDKKDVEYVVQHLADANFDPEFFKPYWEKIVDAYNQQFSSRLKAKSPGGFFAKFLAG